MRSCRSGSALLIGPADGPNFERNIALDILNDRAKVNNGSFPTVCVEDVGISLFFVSCFVLFVWRQSVLGEK